MNNNDIKAYQVVTPDSFHSPVNSAREGHMHYLLWMTTVFFGLIVYVSYRGQAWRFVHFFSYTTGIGMRIRRSIGHG